MRVSYTEAAEFLKSRSDILILMHQSPDGDTLGCGFGLCRVLRLAGIKANAVCSDPVPPKYTFLSEWYEEQQFEPKTIIAVDVADTKLLGKYSSYDGRIDLCIDHHISNTGYADRLLLGENSAAACEVVYRLLKESGFEIDGTAAMCLYTGIATDTGCFKFESVSPETHRIAADLYEYQFPVPAARLNRNIFDIKNRSRIKAESILMNNLEILYNGKCAITYVTAEEQENESVSSDDFDGIASLPMQIEGTEIAVTIKEKAAERGTYKISVRSGEFADVSAICAKFGGGGHIRAAGCTMTGELADVRNKLAAACAEELKNVGLL